MLSNIAIQHKQFDLASVICSHTVELLNNSVCSIVAILTVTTSSCHSETGSNGNEEVLHISQSSKTETSPSDTV